MSAFPRGPGRTSATSPASGSTGRRSTDTFLCIPRLDPEWELAALHTLMKPPRRQVLVRHREPEQRWTPAMRSRAIEVLNAAQERLALALDIAAPEGELLKQSDLLLVVTAKAGSMPTDALRGVALALSVALPDTSIRAGRLIVRQGVFLRRRRGVELTLIPARDVHLSREIRTALSPMLTGPRDKKRSPGPKS